MKLSYIGALLLFLLTGSSPAAESRVSSPDGKISAILVLDETTGSVSYRVNSGGVMVIEESPLGITTNKGDFTSGMSHLGNTPGEVNETYTLPVGKRSTYVNHANELLLRFSKDKHQMHVRFRAYDDGIAYGYAIPGSGDIEISGEISAFDLSGGEITYWGQKHPNSYGYETMLGPVIRLSHPRRPGPGKAGRHERHHAKRPRGPGHFLSGRG